MKLYGLTPSPFYRKCRVVFEEKGLAYEVEPCAPLPKTPELLARHPLGKIPYLVDGELTVPDSSACRIWCTAASPQPNPRPCESRKEVGGCPLCGARRLRHESEAWR